MKKITTSFRNAQAELKITKENYQNKLQEFNLLEQQAQIAQSSGDEATAKQLMKQAIDAEEELSALQKKIIELENTIHQPNKNNLITLLALIPLTLIVVGGIYIITKPKEKPQAIQATCMPSGTKIRIKGSTSMVTINEKLKGQLESSCPGVSLEIAANGSDKGIAELLAGNIDIAAVSRPLTAQEEAKGLVAVNVKEDVIAVMIRRENPFTGGLTTSQLADIFKGVIKDWSAIDGSARAIRVINRSKDSGTRRAFQYLILDNAEFGTTPNITTHEPDETTPIIRELGQDGISYASYLQVKNEQSVRVVPIDNLMPDSPNYGFRRQLRYVYKGQKSPVVETFFNYINTPKAQEAIKSE